MPADAAYPPVPSVWSPRLELVSMTVPFMRALVRRDLAAAAREIDATIPEGMPDDLVNFLEYRLVQAEVDPSTLPWLGRAMVLTDAAGKRHAIGTIGFHGPPDARGRAEVGYRVEPEHRRQGYTSEAVRALFDWAAAEHGIRRFVASISPTNEPSLRLAAGFGFTRTGEQIDDLDGLEYIFEADWPPGATASADGATAR